MGPITNKVGSDLWSSGTYHFDKVKKEVDSDDELIVEDCFEDKRPKRNSAEIDETMRKIIEDINKGPVFIDETEDQNGEKNLKND